MYPEYFEVPRAVLQDDRLSAEEFKFIIQKFSNLEHSQLLTKGKWLLNQSDLVIENDLKQSLFNKKWLIKVNNDVYLKIPPRFISDKKREISYDQIGSQIAQKWDKHCQSFILTPLFLQKMLSFIEDGISEEVIIEVIKISSKRVEGNPANYIISILNDYLNRAIYTIYDFKEEKQRMEEYEKRLREINRKKERRDKEESFEDYYKKGYR